MSKKGSKDRTKFLAKLVTENRVPCAFCQRDVDDEITYGKLYAIGQIQVHYFCVLLSCCLVQKGRDDQGLFGFLYPDIIVELERSKKHKCSYCGKDGATLGCCISQCRKQFHLPCGRERNAVSLFFGNYKSFCQGHAPKQNIAEAVMSKARVRKQEKNRALRALKAAGVSAVKTNDTNESLKAEYVCVICYEEVDAFPTINTFWPPCCARDAWFHRSCLQRMALSAGMHYLKCPLCNDKEDFYQAVVGQGYYVPDRDAAWELEQNAFAEIYERPLSCGLEECHCPMGRNHDAETGLWDIKLCLLCGSVGAHDQCLSLSDLEQKRFVCSVCRPAAPQDMDALAAAVETIIMREQASRSTDRRGPIMPSRMSLRRTKQRMAYATPSSSSQSIDCDQTKQQDSLSNTETSRQDLNIKTPKRRVKREQEALRSIENQMFSPVKLLQQTLKEKAASMHMTSENIVLDEKLVERVRQITKKPKPLCEKKKIVDGLLEELLNTMSRDKVKIKSPVKEWISPKKEIFDITEVGQTDKPITQSKAITEETDNQINLNVEDDSSNSTFVLPQEFIAEHHSDDSLPVFDTPKKLKTVEIQKDSSMEISEGDDVINIDLIKIETGEAQKSISKKCFLKFSPLKEVLENKMDIDVESFKSQYLNEIDRDFKIKTDLTDVSTGNTKRKRKLRAKKGKAKRRKMSKVVLKYGKAQLNRRKKVETSVSISNDDLQVKISLKKKRFRLKIMQGKEKTPKSLKQYVLKYSAGTSKDFIEKPEKDVSPLKRKCMKQVKSPDNLKQTSLHSFFNVQTAKE